MGNPLRQGINATFEVFTERQLFGKPVLRDMSVPTLQIAQHLRHQVGMLGGRNIPVVRNLANIPGPHHIIGVLYKVDQRWIAANGFEGINVSRILRPSQTNFLWQSSEAFAQSV